MRKRHTKRNPHTREEVIALRLKYPGWTLTQLGKEVGVHFNRIAQILTSENLPTRGVKPWRPIKNCGYCKGQNTRRWSKFCSAICHEKYYYVTVKCFFCFEPIEIRRCRFNYHYTLKYTHFYHDLKCSRLGRVFVGHKTS